MNFTPELLLFLNYSVGLTMLPASFQQHLIEAGCDEAGRGCLAGPVCAAAVILPTDFSHPLLNDSKKLTHTVRMKLREVIMEKATTFAIALVQPEEIDRINILQASILAMHRALDQLNTQPEHIIIDGNYFRPYHNIPYATMVKGDGRFANIAAASILAKTSRDLLMEELHLQFPEYQWIKNKGYPTPTHRDAIREFGICEHHRKSFQLLPKQLSLGI